MILGASHQLSNRSSTLLVTLKLTKSYWAATTSEIRDRCRNCELRSVDSSGDIVAKDAGPAVQISNHCLEKNILHSCTRIFNSSSNVDKEIANKEEPTDLKRTSPVRGILLRSNSKGDVYDNNVGRNDKPEGEPIHDNIAPIDGSGARQKHQKKNQLRRYKSRQKVIKMEENRVVVNGKISSWADILSGIPQGSVLGPILFSSIINDLPDVVTSTVKIFGDDTKLFQVIRSTSETALLQPDLDNLVEWFQKWQLGFNKSKCKVIHLGTANTHHQYEMNSVSLASTSRKKI
ncbi:hypothetical protein LSH36_361g05003 [Paralvinella palmiformis]|uniref:Reverse transcriptase domain-containing protein n=1 Tax=Paralvinella palmiformis TaxID=53620 RepID=A0AAD9N114_9ANNE|nr:hypothetical protein LSH36_361g05003 [Paralvinella palmiformis]